MIKGSQKATNYLLQKTSGVFSEFRKNEEGASHILEIAASLAIIAVILAAVFPSITQQIIAKINAAVTQAVNSF